MSQPINSLGYGAGLLLLTRLIVWPAAAADAYELSSEALQQRTFIPHLRAVRSLQSGENLRRLWRNKGVRVLTLERPATLGQHTCQAPTAKLLRRQLDPTLTVFDRYPRVFFERSKVQFLVLCGGLIDTAGAGPGAIPNAALGVLVVDLSYRRSLAGYRAGLHHELYHMFDYALDGSFADPNWARLNPLGFRYRGHGRLHRNASSRLGSGGRGFITEYAQAAVEEDKAELFRALVTEAKKTQQLARQDAILRQKIERLRTELARYGGLDGRFWRR